MPLSPEALYQQVGQLIHGMPDLWAEGPPTKDHHIWLGKLAVLLHEANEISDWAMLTTIAQSFVADDSRDRHAAHIQLIAYRLLAKAELQAPVTGQGAFIPAGNAFDGLAAIAKILQQAKNDVLIVDPYMDEKALTTFAVLADETVMIRLLADRAYVKPSLQPAAAAWSTQYGALRPIQVRVAPAKTLHDRLIIVDGKDAFALHQSLNHFAERAPTSILKSDADTTALKVSAYREIWSASSPM